VGVPETTVVGSADGVEVATEGVPVAGSVGRDVLEVSTGTFTGSEAIGLLFREPGKEHAVRTINNDAKITMRGITA
jgi:hypothetical protein